ncbi:hypothetical protein RYX36_026604 [Vicia faba]
MDPSIHRCTFGCYLLCNEANNNMVSGPDKWKSVRQTFICLYHLVCPLHFNFTTFDENNDDRHPKKTALYFEMVDGGSDGSLGLVSYTTPIIYVFRLSFRRRRGIGVFMKYVVCWVI